LWLANLPVRAEEEAACGSPATRSLPQATLALLLGVLVTPVGLFGHPWWVLAIALVPMNLMCTPTLASGFETVSHLAPSQVRGAALGMQDSAGRLGFSLGGPVVGFVADHSSRGRGGCCTVIQSWWRGSARMHVLVVGAGLGGLCLAQGLRRSWVAVTVYERGSGVTARFQGYRIGLAEHGVEALRAILPERWYRLFEASVGDLAGERPILDQVLPDQQVEVVFRDGTTQRADVLVGADGINSSVRPALTPATAVTDTGVRCVIGRTPLTEDFAALVPGFGTVIKSEDLNLVLGLMRFRSPPREAAARLAPEVSLPDIGDYLRWVMLLPTGHPSPRAPSGPPRRRCWDSSKPGTHGCGRSSRRLTRTTARCCRSRWFGRSSAGSPAR
jgi:hypothetical protein